MTAGLLAKPGGFEGPLTAVRGHFDDVGLLRADYSRKPAFAVYRRLIRRLGRRGGG